MNFSPAGVTLQAADGRGVICFSGSGNSTRVEDQLETQMKF
jgi:hypothetical protein